MELVDQVKQALAALYLYWLLLLLLLLKWSVSILKWINCKKYLEKLKELGVDIEVVSWTRHFLQGWAYQLEIISMTPLPEGSNW